MQKTGRFTETAEIMARNMREQGFNTGEILSQVRQKLNADSAYIMAVAEETREYKAEVKELIKEAKEQALAEGNMLMAMAGDMAFNDDVQMWKAHNIYIKDDNTLSQLKQAFMDQTANSLRNLTQTTGALSVGAGNILNEYQHQLDLATIKMCSGGFSYNQAVKDCCRELAKHGLSVEYPSGRKYNLDSAARMIVRTASSQLAGRISESNMKKTGQALVYVSAHAGARPEHAMWQGKVYLYDQTQAEKYPQYEDFYDATDYGSVTGLKGVNCSHNFYPYWEGDPIPEFKEPEPVNIGGKDYSFYDATQKQRSMERGIKATRLELEAAKAAGLDKAHISDLSHKLMKQAWDYNEFSLKAGLRAKPERYGLIDNNQSRNTKSEGFYTHNDPIRKYLGRAEDSHPAELKKMLEELSEAGAVVTRRENCMGYFPNAIPGAPGNVNVEPDASISAWYHEFKHFTDDRNDGYLGLRVLADIEKCKKRESDAYQIEIDFAKRLGYNDVVRKLIDLRDKEIRRYDIKSN